MYDYNSSLFPHDDMGNIRYVPGKILMSIFD